jgi:Xaa-Pro dipeptidase
MTSEVHSERVNRLRETAADTGAAAVLLYSDAVHSLLSMDPVWWASGFKPLGESAMGIAPDGELSLWVTPEWDGPRAEQTSHGAKAHPCADLVAALASWRADCGVGGDELLVCGTKRLSAARAPAFDVALGEGWRSGDRVVEQVARRRDTAEMRLAEEATLLAEQGYEYLLTVLRPGTPEFAVASLLDVRLRELGSDDNFVLVSASQHNRAVHQPTERLLETGDVFLAEISPSVDGVFTQICRSVCIGTPSDQVREAYELLDSALRAGFDACMPGAEVPSVVRAMDAVMAQAGYGEYCRPPYMRARGHALSLGSTLPGDITSASAEHLEERDYFVLHPNQYLPRSGYLLCGEPIVIQADGAQLVSSGYGALDSVGG